MENTWNFPYDRDRQNLISSPESSSLSVEDDITLPNNGYAGILEITLGDDESSSDNISNLTGSDEGSPDIMRLFPESDEGSPESIRLLTGPLWLGCSQPSSLTPTPRESPE